MSRITNGTAYSTADIPEDLEKVRNGASTPCGTVQARYHNIVGN